MQYQIPKEDLRKYSMKFSLLIMLIAFVSIYVMEKNSHIIFYRTFMAFLHFYFCFRLNILLYAVFSKKNKEINERKKVTIGIGLTAIFILITSYTTQFLIYKGIFPSDLNDSRAIQIFYTWRAFVFIPFLAIVTFSTAHFFHRSVILMHATRQSELEVSRLQTINSETLNQLLKQQIQPHFLFNALNTLKSLIKKHPDVAENYLMQLSDFLRASISEHRSDVVSLKEELALCENYMNMQKTRFGDALQYSNLIEEEGLEQLFVPFFSIQPLLENAIKHNELTKENPLLIKVFIENDVIVVENNLQKRKYVENSTGNGLKNLGERYRLLKEKDIEIIESGDKFIVRLKLISNENSNH